MSGFTLYHGNKNYSSWSMRGWLALRLACPRFEEVAFHLGQDDVRERIRRHSPTAQVPALHHGDLVVWDSLAIVEYLAEQFPTAGLWPESSADRAVARSVCAEMHSGFQALRAQMPFNVRRSSPGKGRQPGVLEEIDRIVDLWTGCRADHAGRGSFLFGEYGAADIFYAPVVSRLRTYGVELSGAIADYSEAVWNHPHVREWCEAARAESWVEPEFDL